MNIFPQFLAVVWYGDSNSNEADKSKQEHSIRIHNSCNSTLPLSRFTTTLYNPLFYPTQMAAIAWPLQISNQRETLVYRPRGRAITNTEALPHWGDPRPDGTGGCYTFNLQCSQRPDPRQYMGRSLSSLWGNVAAIGAWLCRQGGLLLCMKLMACSDFHFSQTLRKL